MLVSIYTNLALVKGQLPPLLSRVDMYVEKYANGHATESDHHQALARLDAVLGKVDALIRDVRNY